MRPVVFLLGIGLALGQCGCSLLGIQPPRYKLIDEAKAFRDMSPPPPVARELAKQPLVPFVVEPGDSLLVQVADFDSAVRLPGDQPVLPDGTIELGKYGRPVVSGKTVPEIEATVTRLVNAGEQAAAKEKGKAEPVTVTVRLIGRQSKVFYVLGEVNAPGAYPLAGRETVLDGLMVAGGLTRQANDRQIIVSRPTQPDGCRVVLPVCYNQIVQLGDTASNYQLQPGDRIYVPSSGMLESLGLGKRPEACGPCVKGQVPCATGTCPPAVGTGVAPPLATLPPGTAP